MIFLLAGAIDIEAFAFLVAIDVAVDVVAAAAAAVVIGALLNEKAMIDFISNGMILLRRL